MSEQDKYDLSNELEILSIEDFRELAQSTRELTKELGLEVLLHRILETASRLTESPDASIILLNEKQDALYIAAATGKDSEWILSTFGKHSEKQIPINSSVAGKVLLSGTSLVENVVKNHFSGVDDVTENKTSCLVCSVLRVGNENLGVIQVLNKTNGKYSKRDLVILEYFANQASLAIRNAKLLEGLLAHSGLYDSNSTTDRLYTRMRELNQDARTETLSVLFSDMRGFTQLCQTLVQPILVQKRLSEFISMLSKAIIEENGIVNKFLGDGAMALFQGEDCSIRAVRCAFAMVEQFSEMKRQWNSTSNQQLDFLDLGIGITTDEVIIGGIGSPEIRDYTAIGTSVNLAAAFENEARNGKHILCDQVTYLNAKDIVSKVNAPEDFILKKPNQDIGVKYKCYNLMRLSSDKQPNLFISHSSVDKDYVEALASKLNERNVKTWYSNDDIPKGTLWTAEIRKAISKCNWMTVIVSKNSANSKWCRLEVDMAIASGNLEDRIIPIVIDDTRPQDVNLYLSNLQAINLEQNKDIVHTLVDRFLIT